MTLAVSTTTLVVAAIAIVAAGIIATVLLRQRRRNVWKNFARNHSLRLGVNAYGPRISGQVQEQEILLEISPRSSDTGALGVEEICMRVEFPPIGWPPNVRIESAQGVTGDVQQAIEPHRIITGNEAFDRDLLVIGSDAEAATAWLTTDRQLAFLNLVTAHRDKFAALDADGLSLRTRTGLSSLKTLNDMLDSLLTAAEAIQQSEESENPQQTTQ